MAFGHVSHGLTFGDLLQWPPAQQHFNHAITLARESGSLYWLRMTTSYLAEALVMRGDLDGAAELLSTMPSDLPMRALGQRRLWMVRARLALARANPAHALDILEQLCATAINFTDAQAIPLLALLRGQSLLALDRHDEAEAALQAALRGADDRGARPLCWRIHLAISQLYRAGGHPTDTSRHRKAAQEIVEALAAPLPGDLRDQFLARVAAMLPADRARIAPRHGHLLTPRERDIAILVARGLSNREIARTLYLGERTVETHVGNILGKLGYSSRTQIAAWTIESGLERAAE
jgi:non-specific serine/threonine protein kinase